MTVLARLVMASFFLLAGLFGVFNFGAVTAEMQAVALPSPELFAVATITTQLVGSFLLITDVRGLGWLGAAMLGVFTLLCIPVAHAFWLHDEPRRTLDFQIALEHIALTGGLLLAAIMSARRQA
ncbi:transmembrane protein [Sphingobium sp. B11D3B]|uniref:DoxX family protein n=1 Tax=Sphingobium sp. B11D3B TaxID=2940575 RepID=UPI0022274830|nr:DoxX family protein [Sphingobium sp. B11D3B]MCW2389610.1 transmembrane protein [Sphingobium sp. B11D3B]